MPGIVIDYGAGDYENQGENRTENILRAVEGFRDLAQTGTGLKKY